MSGEFPALTLFAWGSLGGTATAAAMFALPIVARIALTGELAEHHRIQAIGIALAILLLGCLAGIVAMTLPDTADRGQAIVAGFTSQATFKGIVSAAREALVRSDA